MKLPLFSSLFALFYCFSLLAQPKKIYLAPDDHTDYMWTANEANYHKAFIQTLDYYIRQIDSTSNEPFEHQGKWNCDGSFWMYQYRKNKDKASFLKLINLVKKGNINFPLNPLVCLYGVAPTEAVVRSMYYAGSLEREFGLDINLAFTMEDQVLPLGLSSIFAGSGAKYSWRGICNCVTKVTCLHNRPNQMYWYKGLDDQKVLMKWYSFRLPNKLLGGYSEAYHIDKAIQECKDLMDDNPKYPYRMAAAFGKGGDDFMSLTNKFIVEAKEKSDSSHQIIVSNEVDFLAEFAKQYGENLPSETVSYGTEWGNSVASLAEVSATVKRSMEKLRSAEAMFSLVALKEPNFGKNLKELRETAWLASGLYFEHDWTADGKTISRSERASWQRKIAKQLKAYVDTLYALSFSHLEQKIARPKTKNQCFFVFNPLGWERNDVATFPYKGKHEDITILDRRTKKKVPHQLLEKKEGLYIQILAENVPALGYKVFEVAPLYAGKMTKKNAVPGLRLDKNVFENEFYKIELMQSGAMKSWFDKSQRKELIAKSITMTFNGLVPDSSIGIGEITLEESGPVSVLVRIETKSPLRKTTKIRLFQNSERVEIENTILQNFSKTTCYGFPLNFKKPEIWHEEVGAILNAKPVSKGGHYADSLSRLDWLTLNHFVDVSDSLGGVTISNRDAYFVKPGKSDIHFLDHSSAEIQVLAGGQIDAEYKLGIENQGGDSVLQNHFALRSYKGKFSPSKSMQFSLEHQSPLIVGMPMGKAGYPNSGFSLIRIEDPEILLWSVKPSEEGMENGLIVKAWNLSEQDKIFSISSPLEITKAKTCTHIETDIGPLVLSYKKLINPIGHHQMKSYRVFLK